MCVVALTVEGTVVVAVDEINELLFAHATYEARWVPADGASVVTTPTLVIDKLWGKHGEFPNIYLAVAVVTGLGRNNEVTYIGHHRSP